MHAPAPKIVSEPHHSVGGAAKPKHVAVLQTQTKPAAVPQSIADDTHNGVVGPGTGTGAGPGSGEGGLGGTGTGTGGTGNGTGGDANTAPCGDIFLLPGDLQYRRDGTAVQGVLAKVVLLDGTVQLGAFPYPFTYPSKLEDPFVTLPPGGTIPVQEPPPGSDLSAMPPAVQVVLKHTNPDTGKTSMPECTHDDPAA